MMQIIIQSKIIVPETYIMICPLVVPGAPSIITIVVTGSRAANLSWQEGVAPNPQNPVILSFAVYLNDSLIINTMATSVVLSSLTPFTDYKVIVAARNRIGISNMSTPVLFMTEEEGKFM